MIKRILLLVFLSLSISTFSQEICDNGIDDDGDGFIDLQDNDCHCGAGLNAQFNNAIPNADFDSSLCCPTTWWDHLNCLADWTTDSTQYYNSWSLNYVNSCNGCNYWNTTAYITPPNCGIGGNNGFLGMGFWNWNNNIYNYNNFANACLNTPLYPGNTYVLEFDAFNTYNYNWQFTDDTIHIAIYGSTSCANIPITNQACNDPDWDGLDSLDIIVPVDTAWHNYAFSFSPTDTVYALALGQTCSSYNNNQTYTGWQRILLDNLTLYDSKIYNLQIADSGSFCNPPYLLTSTIDTLGGTWQWYKDSVALIGETNPTIDITSMGAGNYTVLYQMNGTCQGLNLEILPAVYPFAFISSANTEACVGDSVAFDGISFIATGTIDNFYYDFGNGDSAFVEDPIYAYSTPGTYSVAFTAESDQGCTAGQTQNIVIHPQPTVDFVTANTCLYDAANFVSMITLSSGFIDSLSWDFGDNIFGDDSLETHQYSTYGNFAVELFARSDKGCIDSSSQNLIVHPIPEANYTALNSCENIDITFSNQSTIAAGTIDLFVWDFGDNSTSNLENISHTYLNEGTYNTTLHITSDSGCVDSTNLNLTVYPEPEANFNWNSSCFFAEFENTSTIASGQIVTNNWDFGNTLTSTLEDPTHYYTVNGNYNVSLQTISNFGCEDDTVVPITIFSNFYADLSPKTNFICVGECVKLLNNSTPTPNQVMEYYWRTSDGQISEDRNPTFCFNNATNEPTSFDVFFKISTSSGCLDSLLVEDAITVIPIPVANFTYSPEKPTLSNPEVIFTNKSLLATNYEWNFGDNSFSDEINPTHIYPEVGKSYTVRLTASDANNTCDDEYSATLIVEDEILFFIPNTFTPDGFGKNEVFKPYFKSGVDIYAFRMQIFNRFGEIIFESHDPEGTWNGRYNGELVPTGTYIWKIDFDESMKDKPHTHTGTVNVLR